MNPNFSHWYPCSESVALEIGRHQVAPAPSLRPQESSQGIKGDRAEITMVDRAETLQRGIVEKALQLSGANACLTWGPWVNPKWSGNW